MAALIQSVSRAISILDLLTHRAEGLVVKEIAGQLRLNVSTTHHLVNTLEARNYLFRQPDGTYTLGAAVPRLYGAFLQTAQPNARFAPLMQALARTTRETTYTCVWQGDEIVIQDIVEGSQALRVGGLHVGFNGYAHARASGKALLAYLAGPELERYLVAHPLTGRTARTITNKSALATHLEQVRQQGYAIDCEEYAEGVRCVAAPIFVAAGQAMAAFSVSVPAERFRRHERSLIQAVVQAATEASALLGFVPPGQRIEAELRSVARRDDRAGSGPKGRRSSPHTGARRGAPPAARKGK